MNNKFLNDLPQGYGISVFQLRSNDCKHISNEPMSPIEENTVHTGHPVNEFVGAAHSDYPTCDGFGCVARSDYPTCDGFWGVGHSNSDDWNNNSFCISSPNYRNAEPSARYIYTSDFTTQNDRRKIHCNSQPFHDILSLQQNTKGDDAMSLIIMMKSKNGLVAVSDSKSTYSLFFGYREEKGRIATKLFKGGNYILATCGANRIGYTPIEDILQDLIGKFPMNFLEVINVLKGSRGLYGNYQIMVAVKEQQFVAGNVSSAYVIHEYRFDNNKLVTENLFDSIAGGFAFGLGNMVPSGATNVDPEWTLEELKEKATFLFKHAIEFADEFCEYNPIGGEMQMLTLSEDE